MLQPITMNTRSIKSRANYKRIQKARQDDIQRSRYEVAQYLLTQGLAVAKIAIATKLTLTEIEKLRVVINVSLI